MTPMKLQLGKTPARLNWLGRTLNAAYSFRRQGKERWRRATTGMRSWRRGRGRPT